MKTLEDTLWEWGQAEYVDFVRLVCGELIGSGVSRDVFGCAIDDSLVVKIERDTNETSQLQNLQEWLIWNWARTEPLERWLAPCRGISRNGRVLLQARTTPVSEEELAVVPKVFEDVCRGNFGRLRGSIVCHDYGILLWGLMRRGAGCQEEKGMTNEETEKRITKLRDQAEDIRFGAEDAAMALEEEAAELEAQMREQEDEG